MEVEVEDPNNDALCRLCDCSNDELVSIFDKSESGDEIINIINNSLPLNIHKTDQLSKFICGTCLKNVNNVYEFKQKCFEVARKYKNELNGDTQNENSSDEKTNSSSNDEKTDASTSTEDLFIFCTNCRNEILEANEVDKEIELCTDLRQAIIDSFRKNKILLEDKPMRTRRKKNQPFYNELEDSTCSSMTEFTNTESSQCFDLENDIESSSDSETQSEPPSKRRKVENTTIVPTTSVPEVNYEALYSIEPEVRYFPLSLFSICIQAINSHNIGDEYWPDRYEKVIVTPPPCSVCKQTFPNMKLLAMHEAKKHINIEMTEHVDELMEWHESRDYSGVRNKWLKDYIQRQSEPKDANSGVNEESLLIPVSSNSLAIIDPPRPEEESSTEAITSSDQSTAPEVKLVDGRPFVDGVPLGDFTKEERRAFYRSLRVGGVVKRFCKLCRYSFKDNWAIEAHYFSMACYFTCRYCGMRFNKQRARFKEHVDQHKEQKDPISTKVFAASKLNNIVPKVVYPQKRQKTIPQIIPTPRLQSNKIKSIMPVKQEVKPESSGIQTPVKIKQEPISNDEQANQSQTSSSQLQTSQSKTGNQAYFCRRCYKVFFKLDEFKIHSKNCDHNQYPNAMSYFAPPPQAPTPPKVQPQPQPPPPPANNYNGDTKTSQSPSGRPLRNCVKEAGPYRDEVYLPEHLLKPEPVRLTNQQMQHGGYVCYICNTPFPTIYSRNSHMRIHKAETMPGVHNQMQQNKPQAPETYQQMQDPYQHAQEPYQQMSVAHLAQVKQEPLEPEVQIHEQIKPEPDYIGLGPAISITPIPKKNLPLEQQQYQNAQKSNPGAIQLPGFQNNEVDRTYKCSSCWEAFSNKSHLYFHKKTQCEGSKYPCPFCKKRFGTEAAYSSHIFYSHPE